MLLPLLTRVSPHVALEVKGIVKALATTAAHVAACGAVALEVPCQHALQREGLGAERAAKHPRVPGSGDQSALRGLWEGHGSSDTHTHTHTGAEYLELGTMEVREGQRLFACKCHPFSHIFPDHAPLPLPYFIFSTAHTICQHNMYFLNFIVYTYSPLQIINSRKEGIFCHSC